MASLKCSPLQTKSRVKRGDHPKQSFRKVLTLKLTSNACFVKWKWNKHNFVDNLIYWFISTCVHFQVEFAQPKSLFLVCHAKWTKVRKFPSIKDRNNEAKNDLWISVPYVGSFNASMSYCPADWQERMHGSNCQFLCEMIDAPGITLTNEQ